MLVEASGTQTLLSVVDHRSAEVPPPHTNAHTHAHPHTNTHTHIHPHTNTHTHTHPTATM